MDHNLVIDIIEPIIERMFSVSNQPNRKKSVFFPVSATPTGGCNGTWYRSLFHEWLHGPRQASNVEHSEWGERVGGAAGFGEVFGMTTLLQLLETECLKCKLHGCSLGDDHPNYKQTIRQFDLNIS